MPESYSWRKYKRQVTCSVTGIVFILRVDPVVNVVIITGINNMTRVTNVTIVTHVFK